MRLSKLKRNGRHMIFTKCCREERAEDGSGVSLPLCGDMFPLPLTSPTYPIITLTLLHSLPSSRDFTNEYICIHVYISLCITHI